MNSFRIVMGATALTVAAVAIIACSKEKTAQQETTTQQHVESKDYTLAEMAEAMSWEEGKAFLENQPIKDYTDVCEKVLNDCGTNRNLSQELLYGITWYWRSPAGCDANYKGVCIISRMDAVLEQTNARGYYEDGKLIIIPTTDEDGFTVDGFLVIGTPIVVENDTLVLREGIYTAYYDDELGRYVAVAVDVDTTN